MNGKSKTFIAIFAVFIMLSGALVPITYSGSEAVVVGQSTDDETSDFSIASFIEKIKEKGSELLDEIEIGNGFKLVPTNETMTAENATEIKEVKGKVTEKASETYTLGSKVVFSKNDSGVQGELVFPALSTLILFPQGQNSTYEIVNQNAGISGKMTLISLELGAKIVLFDKVFLVSSSGSEESSLKLLEASFTDSAAETKSTFSYTKNANGTYKLALWVGKNATIRIAEALSLHDNTMYKKDVFDKDGKKIFSKDGPDMQFNGTIVTSADSISAAGSVMVNARWEGSKLMQGHFVIDSASLETISSITSKDHWSLSSTVDVSISSIYMQMFKVNKTWEDPILRVVVNNGTVQTGDITASMSYDKSGTAAVTIQKFNVSLTKEKDLVVAADDVLLVDVSMSPQTNDGFTNVNISDLKLTIGKTALTMEYDSATETRAYIIDASTSASFTVGQIAALMYNIQSDGKDPVLAAKIMVNDIKLTLGDTSVKGEFSSDMASPARSLTASTSVSFSINNAAGVITGIEKTYALAKDVQLNFLGLSVKMTNKNNVVVSLDELSVKGTVCKDGFSLAGLMISPLSYFTYDTTLNFEIKGVKSTMIDSVTAISIDGVVLSGKVLFNGKDRELRIGLENITGSFSDTDSYKLTVGKMAVANDLSLDIFDGLTGKMLYMPKLVNKIASLVGIGSAQGEIVATNLSVDGKTEKVTADSLTLMVKNGVKFREMFVKYSDNLVFSMDQSESEMRYVYMGLRIQCGNVNGYYVGYDGGKNNFSITDGADSGFGIAIMTGSESNFNIPINVMGMISIYDGNAKFEGGKIPFAISVGENAKFSANGLTAPLFYFKNGCEKSGTVILDTDAFPVVDFTMSYGGYEMTITIDRPVTLIDGDYVISTYDGAGYPVHGFKLIYDLSDINNGKIEANKGNTLPVKWSNDSGFSMESDDGQTGTFTITRNTDDYTIVDVQCVKKQYTLSYEDDLVASEEYRYGDTVEITSKTPVKDGYDFLGWTDGASQYIYEAGNEYTMPARDVVLKPVFTKTVTPEVVMEGEDKTLVVDATDVPIVCVDVTQSDWTKITINTENSSVTFDKETYNAINEDSQLIAFGCVKMDKADDDNVSDAVGSKQLYLMKLKVFDGKNWNDVSDYSGYTTFQVTVNVHTDKDVRDFKIYYVNEEGYIEEVGIDSYEKLGDGSYNVTFTVNHFSMYAVEPVYPDTVDNLFILVGLIIAITLICVLLGAAFGKKSKA